MSGKAKVTVTAERQALAERGILLRKKQVMQLRLTASRWKAEVQEELAAIVEHPVWGSGALSLDNQCRLLNLKTLTIRYRLSLRSILTILIASFKANKYRQSAPGGLGFSISQLCGPHSDKIISEYVRANYKLGENIRAWHSDRQLIETSGSYTTAAFDVDDPLAFVREYKSRIAKARREQNRMASTKVKRPYRGNAWLS